jgi:hypothetical protein
MILIGKTEQHQHATKGKNERLGGKGKIKQNSRVPTIEKLQSNWRARPVNFSANVFFRHGNEQE